MRECKFYVYVLKSILDAIGFLFNFIILLNKNMFMII